MSTAPAIPSTTGPLTSPPTGSAPPRPEMLRVGTLDELRAKTCIVVRGDDHPIAVFADKEGNVFAVDNRCPHMGFPLSRGTVSGGVLTCHWHHARFEGSSGCTFDLFADDVAPAETLVRDGVVWVARRCHAPDPAEHGRRRQREGMEQSIGLVIAKAVITRMRAGTPPSEVVRDGMLFGTRHRDGFSPGMVICAAMANLLPDLPDEERMLALWHGLSRIAEDCAGSVPRRDRHPLEGSTATPEKLRQWIRDWSRARHRDGAERTLLTAIAQGAAPADLAEMLLVAVTDRIYANGGHALDFINKACETLDLIGWDHADKVLPSLVPQLVSARGGEEQSAWHHPIDLTKLMHDAARDIPAWLAAGRGRAWDGEQRLAEDVLEDDPAKVVAALADALRGGATPVQLARSVCLAAATRVARFGTANEFGDWIAALHTFTYNNALHQSLKRLSAGGRTPAAEVVRGVFHGAMVVYLDRFLNVPPAALPGERDAKELEAESADAGELLERFLSHLNSQQRVNAAARTVARHLSLGHPTAPLIAALARAVLREDAEFHTYQMLEAGVRQFREWGETTEPARRVLMAVVRYVAAHSPTQRAQLQTAEIALKLDRGRSLYDGDDADDAANDAGGAAAVAGGE
jgi:nitrite reductase/ring-hydroxylating ferredoxin subunit